MYSKAVRRSPVPVVLETPALRPYQAAAVAAALGNLQPREPIAVVQPPGAGKTAIGVAVAVRQYSRNGRPVAYIAPHRVLLDQAIGHLRGGANHRADVIFATTISALRVLEGRRARDVSLIIIDESHWAEDRTGDGILAWAARASVPVLGLTATPRSRSRYRVVHEVTQAELIDAGFLAAIHTEQVQTGVIWTAVERGDDLSYQSLHELARNVDRNRLIVAATLARPYLLPAFVFACDIAHARELAGRFRAAGLSAHEFHGKSARSEEALVAFRSGEADILVGVNSLALGVDAPRARGVVLARPTRSNTLQTQMIGRGTRMDPSTGKDRVHILELADRARGSSPILTSVRSRPTSRWSTVRRHHFEPLSDAGLVRGDAYPSIAGLWYRKGQTFGIEIEVAHRTGLPTYRTYDAVRSEMASSLEEALGSGDRWAIKLDLSAGWEVVSPILEGADGLEEMVLATQAVSRVADRHGLVLSRRCGLHVHLGLNNDYRLMRRVLRATRLFESAVATIVAPSRIAWHTGARYSTVDPNGFCVPLRVAVPRSKIDRATSLADLTTSRYLSVNPLALAKHGTIEVRLHHGTVDPSKIALWVSLWQQIVAYAERAKRIRRVSDVRWLEPDGDIVALAKRLLPGADERFLERLRERRSEILRRWDAPGLESWSPHRERFRSGT